MSLAGSIDWRWQRRPDPASPRAVVAWAEAAPRLHARLHNLAAEHQARLLATASRDVFIVSGETLDLPWVEGAAYAAPSVEAPGLWLPTLWCPDMPSELIARALLTRHARQPLLLWPDPETIVPMDRQLPVSPALLARIASHWQGVRP